MTVDLLIHLAGISLNVQGLGVACHTDRGSIVRDNEFHGKQDGKPHVPEPKACLGYKTSQKAGSCMAATG